MAKRKREVSDADKLVHESTKVLHRAAKKAKAFEVQKAIRRLKDAGGGDGAPNATRLRDAEKGVAAAKGVDVDAIVAACLRRCGVAHVGSSGEAVAAAVAADASCGRVARHKLVAAAARDVDARATDARRRALLKADPQLRAMARADAKADAADAKRKRREKRASGLNALFVDSLDGAAAAAAAPEEAGDGGGDDDGADNPYGPAEPVQKNRMGSRMRRELREKAAAGDGRAASALARAGLRQVKRGEDVANGPRAPKPAPAPDRTRRAPPPKVEKRETAAAAASHGSWAAARAKLEKERSAAFAGTKVRFD